MIDPEVIFNMFFGNNPKIERDVIDFPEPDSPTIPRISFFLIKMKYYVIYELLSYLKIWKPKDLITVRIKVLPLVIRSF